MFKEMADVGLVACAKCKHAVWPKMIRAYLQGAEHRLSKKEAAGV